MSVRPIPALVVSIICTALAGKFGWDWREENATYRDQIASTKEQQGKAQRTSALLKRALQGAQASAPQRLEVALSLARSRVSDRAFARQVKVGSVTVKRFVGSNGLASIRTVALTTPLGLRFVTLEVKGTFDDLEQFLMYLDEIRSSGVTVSEIKMTDRNKFELVADVYGT